MRHILGLSAFYHDSAAALLRDGEIIAAAQEERFTRIKHDHNFPSRAIEYCLQEAGIGHAGVDAVIFFEKPLLKFERLLETYLAYAPRGLRQFMKALPLWCNKKLFIPREIDRGMNQVFEGPIFFCQHHQSHAASAFYPSPFDEAAILTMDGVGEWATTSWGVGRGNHIDLTHEIRFPHSLGLLYSAFTYYTGFKVNSGEYKLMGLAPYGTPRYADLIRNHLLDIKPDGSFWMDQRYFDYSAGLVMTSPRFHELFGGKPRREESPLTQRDMDLAASIQLVTEEAVLQITRHVHAQTGQENLCLAGGVALNCVANGKILADKKFKRIWIQPAAGDAGGALGAALFAWHEIAQADRKTSGGTDSQKGSCLGPAPEDEKTRRYLDKIGAPYHHFTDEKTLCEKIARILAEEKIVGHVHGRMEFGPRALGHRSILGDPRSPRMQAQMNVKIKFRESFRPFAPSCLEEKVSDYFEIDQASPYMLLVAPVKNSRRLPLNEGEKALLGIEKLKCLRSDMPSVTHVDYSARIQTVTAERSPRYHAIIKEFENLTGYGVVVNTSFNIRGEPIVNTCEEAYRCFMFTDMDALVLGNFICLKEEQPSMEGAEAYKKQFKLD